MAARSREMILLALAALATPAPTSTAAAAGVVARYYALLDRRSYAAAYALWGDGGRASGRSLAAFRRGFARTRATAVTVSRASLPEGGAGSLYVTVPVSVRARLDDGTHQRFGGTYVVRRVNDVPGSTAAQRRWHIDSAHLRPLPPG